MGSELSRPLRRSDASRCNYVIPTSHQVFRKCCPPSSLYPPNMSKITWYSIGLPPALTSIKPSAFHPVSSSSTPRFFGAPAQHNLLSTSPDPSQLYRPGGTINTHDVLSSPKSRQGGAPASQSTRFLRRCVEVCYDECCVGYAGAERSPGECGLLLGGQLTTPTLSSALQLCLCGRKMEASY